MSSPSRSGVFEQSADRRLEQFTESISADQRLYTQDIAGSIAHVQMLAKVGLLTAAESRQIEQALEQIRQELQRGELPLRPELEDIHMHVEQALIDRLGDVGRKLHAARSRNDQVATDLRLWSRDAIDQLDDRVLRLQQAFVGRCPDDLQIVLPAYTHLQRAQPVLAPHYWLAYCEKLQRDRDRLADCRRRVNVCSLGAAAVAGTSLPIDRHDVAQRLGFAEVAANSLDVASDRDFVVELAFVLALLAEHLGGWADEWILWSTTEFGFLELPQEFCTGSSIMPQKINPDVLELIRGRTARALGNLQSLLALIKGLPLAYHRDLQEDKRPLFDSVDSVSASLELAVPIVREARLKKTSIAQGLDRGYLDATTLMEFMIQCGVPQRTAHHLVGQLVQTAQQRGVPLSELELEVFQQAHPALNGDVYEVLGAEKAVAAFQSYGSTGPSQVKQQIERWQKRLGM